MNYENYYNERYQYHIQYLEDRFQKEVIDKRGAKNDLRNEFVRWILFNREQTYQQRVPNVIDAMSYTDTLYNSFKKRVIDRFLSIERNFPEEGIKGFIELDIPNIRKEHIGYYENGSTKSYRYDTQYMYDATDLEILELIAKHYAYHDYNVPELKRFNKQVKPIEVAEESTDNKQGSIAQVVGLILSINDEYKFIKAQDNKAIVEFIHFLTGRNKKNIGTFVSKYLSNNGEIQLTPKQNLKDYGIIKNIIKITENQKLIKSINQKIDKQNQHIAKSGVTP